ncbi:hypothetical protein SAMN05444411_11254 [Lutibacter oricola]|uniref:Cellobiose phosphorylase n=1 Tax=Lutibacter oricola TaxID=762486 RepID=A0A1H3FTT0_9FLAO|nr:hypothetical protein [Lutibacter oricola]SDX94361.1 hypothetical protein SAMN05444411_11254 [Lutibacter oricola]
MNKQNSMFIGSTKVSFEENEVKGKQVVIGGENYYKISNVNEMRPFFMSIVSYSNHWMFLSSNGGLTAGRKNAQFALFPYYTDDKITEFVEITGSKTILKVQLDNKTYLWEPFSNRFEGAYKIKRNLFKNNYGNKVIFEEINEDLGVSFQYSWNSSEKYGFVKKSTIKNSSFKNITIEVLDGLQNILPYGVGDALQNASSNLVDAYKRSELNEKEGVGIYALSAIIVDKAEPSEALKSNVVWSLGLENPTYLLSSLQLDNFRKGKEIQQETDVKAEKGAYFIQTEFGLDSETEKTWFTIADVTKSVSEVNEIKSWIQTEENLIELVKKDIEEGTNELVTLNGNADGIQLTADDLTNTRHFANTLFNIMRGGIFDDNYKIEKADFVPYIANANKEVYKNQKTTLEQLPEEFTLIYLKELAAQEDKDFKRLCLEYMPLKFSRRHGDPSRPWNKFSINTKSEIDGSKILDYQGNWRDIFQNWEALAHSYPEFIESMIHKFLNATTFDGYNPYRVTKGGFDWETIEPDDPWSYIGYWGDHQIIYLLKFLEFSEKYFPNKLAELFSQNVFVYANVPYTIKSYAEILKNSKDTIDFNHEAQDLIEKERELIGVDGALLKDSNNGIYKVNFVEKILATVLAKVSNLIPEGGIWMNTQRPEWNDANNALVGNGVSMVTLYYLRRFLSFFENVVENTSNEANEVSTELANFFKKVVDTLVKNEGILSSDISDKQRKTVLDGLGQAGSDFRETIYTNGFSSKKENISKDELLGFVEITLKYINQTIEANKRADNLYHAYNLMTIENDEEVSISYLSEMLEGQVAVLSSGYVKGKEALELLDALKASALFRPDQYSYILYPNKNLSGFNVKNNIPSKKVENSELLKQLVTDNNRQIVEKDVFGAYHFNGTFNNANSLKSALKNLPEDYNSLVEKDSEKLLETFEEVFNHKAFTGRSGTFFGYEGLGSIYWHMVSKLLLAVQEICLQAVEEKEDEAVIGKLLDHYYEIEAGIGVHKSPELYGAFPTDPYSHTPGGKGAQQPGMTGQVKEDFICRFGELGVFVKDGKVGFNPRLLRKNEFLIAPSIFKYQSINKENKELQLQVGSLCYTYCQVPVIYKLGLKNEVEVIFEDSSSKQFSTLELDAETSSKLFKRTGEINKIIVSIKE